MNARYWPCLSVYGWRMRGARSPAGSLERNVAVVYVGIDKHLVQRWIRFRQGARHGSLIACLGYLVILRRVRFAGDAREAHISNFRRADDPGSPQLHRAPALYAASARRSRLITSRSFEPGLDFRCLRT